MLRETDTEWDCLADRTAALEEQKVYCALATSHNMFAIRSRFFTNDLLCFPNP